jgi:hypothetical protein
MDVTDEYDQDNDGKQQILCLQHNHERKQMTTEYYYIVMFI